MVAAPRASHHGRRHEAESSGSRAGSNLIWHALAISHQAYDRTDALQDLNLVFPIERLRELEAERVVGRLAEHHYGFGLMGSVRRLMPAIKEVARRIGVAGVDLALLVPA